MGDDGGAETSDASTSSSLSRHAAVLLANGTVLVTGGQVSGGVTAAARVYDPASALYQAVADLTTPRRGHTTTRLPDGRVLLAGGNDGQTTLVSLETFEPTTGAFTRLAAALQWAREGHTATAMDDGRVLFRGGNATADGGSPPDEIYDPAADVVIPAGSLDGIVLPTLASDKPDYAPGDTIRISGTGWHANEAVGLLIIEDPLIHAPVVFGTTADAQGHIYDASRLVEAHDIDMRFVLEGRGAASGLTARTLFTDARDDCQTSGFPVGHSCGNGCGVCALQNNNQTRCQPVSSGQICRPSAGPCDVAESCTGTSIDCPADVFTPTTTVCRAAAGECDLADTCSGSSAACPADARKSAGTACSDDGSPCTTDLCDGLALGCQHAPGNAGVVCRAAAGPCDVAEACTGSSSACPTEAFAASTTVCRAAAGECDVAETCTGSSAACPSDAHKPAGEVCRPSAGPCDRAEACTGTSSTCPADAFAPSTTVCRAAGGECDVAESCTGSSANCPSDARKPAGTACSDDGSPCTTDLCDGLALGCQHAPGNAGVVCRAAAGPCDMAEACTGTSSACPTDAFAAPTTVCRAATGECDVAESCTGSSAACPSDAHRPAGVVCRPSAGPCDMAEACTGSSSTCPADAFAPSTTVCRAAGGECDVAESCTGSSANCPSDAHKPAGTACSDDGSPCTTDLCDGLALGCQHAPGNAGIVCRAAAGECDVAESCTGSSVDCPSDARKPAGTACSDDGNACTLDHCDGTSLSCQHPPETTPPTITACSVPAPVECTSPAGAAVDFNFSATDACQPLHTDCSAPGGSTFALGSTQVACTATDGNGNSSQCSLTVVVQDTTPPSITCPADAMVECTGNHHALVGAGAATGQDLCGSVTVNDPAPTLVEIGHPVSATHTATDQAGLVSSCSNRLTVVDTTSPVITCPANMTAECTGNHQAVMDVEAASASDVCGSVTVGDPPAASYPLGTTSVGQSATDEAGHSSACSSQVTVVDTTPPAIQCPPDVTAECTGAHQASGVFAGAAFGSDVCGGVNVSDPGSASYPLGASTIRHVAIDDVGLQASCTNRVMVIDTLPPTIACPPDVTVECTADHRASGVSAGAATASDVCGGVAVQDPLLSDYTLGTTAATHSAVDDSGNAATCSNVVAVVDTLPPSITCPADVIVECNAPGAATGVGAGAVSASDLCTRVQVVDPAIATYPLGATTVVHGATDESGNQSACTNQVIVRDTTPPVFDPKSLGPRTLLGNCSGAPVGFALPTATDACQAVTVSCASLPGTSVGTNVISCTATDASGNQATAQLTVNVLPPLQVKVLAPLYDDNVANDINTDVDVSNVFQVKSTIPNKVKLFACNGADVTNANSNLVTLRLSVSFRSDTSPISGTSIVPTSSGVGDAGGVLVYDGVSNQFQYNLKTDPATYPSGTVANSNFFDIIYAVTYNSAPSIAAGVEDARLESR